MSVARLQRGLLHLRLHTVLSKLNMANVPTEAVVAMVTGSTQDGQVSGGTKRPLESEERVGSPSLAATTIATTAVTAEAAALATAAATTLAAAAAASTVTIVATTTATTIATTVTTTEATALATAAAASTATVVATSAATTVASATTASSTAASVASTAAAPTATFVASTATAPTATFVASTAAAPTATCTATTVASTAATTEATNAAASVATACTSGEPPLKKLKTEDENSNTNLNKLVKRKVAMLLSYSGVGYKGMQKNPGEKTIEEDLAAALLKSEVITKEQAENFGKMAFQRCARTDKGVSAAGQTVSLKMKLIDNVVDKINQHLPPCIRVMGVKRTTGSFNSKHNCDFRTYMYMLPTFAFEPIDQITTESYRITAEKLKEISDLLAQYVGTHNFHNFTSGKAFKDPSAKRFIREFTCDEPFMYRELEFVILRVRGQSFVLHQIRKMIGLVIAIAKGFAPCSTLEKAFRADKLDIPRAPGLGLVLESVHYDAYNRRWGTDGMHEPLTWDECEDQLEAFKREHIYSTIVTTEKKEKSMMQWLSTLPLHTYDVIETPNPYRRTARQIEQDRQEKKERLSFSSANSETKEARPLQSASSSQQREGDGGPEVTSTTSQGQSDQDGGLERTSAADIHKVDCTTTSSTSEVKLMESSNEKQDGVAITEKENPSDKITSTSEGLATESGKT